ncbi:MAG TPA: M12 family metallopeptidase [Kofleriaceae bacterium]|nr:M12 family metallopeptidase [Kofleriaceae bacterium]
MDAGIPLREGKGSNPTAAVTSNLWPTKVIVYEFDPAVDATTRQRVIDAMNPWKSAGIIFRQRTNQSSYVRITTEYLSQYPFVCKVATIGYQQVNTYYAGRNCRMRDFVHEWGHILGLFHEHQRTDRDQFVIVDASIGDTIAGMGSDWAPTTSARSCTTMPTVGTRTARSNYDKVLITPRDGRPLNSFGWNDTPSSEDLSAVSSLYANRSPGVPLYQLYNQQYQDWFYTTNPNERLVAMQYYGYSDYGVARRSTRTARSTPTAPRPRLTRRTCAVVVT